MNLPFVDLKGNRIQAAKAFAEQFSEFEWQYLCSYQWFLTGVDQALATGDFFPLNVRAERTLRRPDPATLEREPGPMLF